MGLRNIAARLAGLGIWCLFAGCVLDGFGLLLSVWVLLRVGGVAGGVCVWVWVPSGSVAVVVIVGSCFWCGQCLIFGGPYGFAGVFASLF